MTVDWITLKHIALDALDLPAEPPLSVRNKGMPRGYGPLSGSARARRRRRPGGFHAAAGAQSAPPLRTSTAHRDDVTCTRPPDCA